MWIKIVFRNNIEILNTLTPELLEDGMSYSLIDSIKNKLNIPDELILMYDFNEYCKFNKHIFYSCKFVPEILQKLVLREFRLKGSLQNLKDILHPDLPFTKWLHLLYNTNTPRFSLFIH
jgi:hypothetical protein